MFNTKMNSLKNTRETIKGDYFFIHIRFDSCQRTVGLFYKLLNYI